MTDEPDLPAQLGPDGLGLDVEPLARWHALHADAVAWERLGRSFTAAERDDIEASDDPATAAASRWVAKEAVVKALGGHAGLRDVEVLRRATGGLVVTRPTLPHHVVLVSVSHTRDHVFGAAWTSSREGSQHAATRPT